jgi:hypothetical protein
MPEPVTLEEQFDETHNVPASGRGGMRLGSPIVFMDDESVSIVAGESDRPDRGISVTHIVRNANHGAHELSRRCRKTSAFGCGYWRLNPLVLTCIGSSAAMPVPMLVYGAPRILSRGAGHGEYRSVDRRVKYAG